MMDEHHQEPANAPASTESQTPNEQWPSLGPVLPNPPSDIFDTSSGTWQPVPPSDDPSGNIPGMPTPIIPPAGWPVPGVPGAPSTPLTPGTSVPWAPPPNIFPAPQQPGTTGMPSYAPYPGIPTPLFQGYPGSPSMPLPPGTGAPLMPLPTGNPMLGQPGYPSYPLTGAPVTVPLGWQTMGPQFSPVPAEPSMLVRPFSLGLSACLFFGSLALVGFVTGAAISAAGADWSDGAKVAGFTALGLAVATLFVALLRILLGRRARSTYVLSALMLVVLLVTGIGSLNFSAPLHGIQAHALERDRQWSRAIHEYALGGQSAPNAPDIARVYDEWGEDQLTQKQYPGAVTHFNDVVTDYSKSGDAVTRAKKDLFAAYSGWLQSGATDVTYVDAINVLVSYASVPDCDTACQATAQDLEAQARYQYGTQLAAKADITNDTAAIEQFETIQTKYPKSPYASEAHTAAAQTYWALGQLQLDGQCLVAVTTYTTLTKQYGDTPEGKKAAADLNKGVDVSGVLEKMPTNPLPTLSLSKHVDQASFYLSAEYTTTPDGSGHFVFHRVAPGDYNIASVHPNGSVVDYIWWYHGSRQFYFVHVGPLCPVQVETLSY